MGRDSHRWLGAARWTQCVHWGLSTVKDLDWASPVVRYLELMSQLQQLEAPIRQVRLLPSSPPPFPRHFILIVPRRARPKLH